jgi:transcriptional regulator with XRE-family HTH domain
MVENKMSQKAVAQAIGVSRQTIQDWKNKPAVKPKRANVKALAKLFGVPANEFFEAIDGEDDEGLVVSAPIWRMFVNDYRQSKQGRDTPAAVLERLYRAPHGQFSRKLVHAMRLELEQSSKTKR